MMRSNIFATSEAYLANETTYPPRSLILLPLLDLFPVLTRMTVQQQNSSGSGFSALII
jgi:hypothetical protein